MRRQTRRPATSSLDGLRPLPRGPFGPVTIYAPISADLVQDGPTGAA